MLNTNLKKLMDLRSISSASELSKLTGIPQPTLHHILSGATLKPRLNLLAALADYFSVTVEQLSGKEALPLLLPEIVKASFNVNEIPLLKWGEIKYWPHINYQQCEKIIIENNNNPNCFATAIVNDSYEPAFSKNTLLIFSADIAIKDKNYAIAYLMDDDAIIFNRVFIDGNNTYIKDETDEDNISLKKLDLIKNRIIGVLIEARIKY